MFKKILLIFIFSSYSTILQAKDVKITDYSTIIKDTDSSSRGYGISVILKRITASGYQNHQILVASWVKDRKGNFEAYSGDINFTVNSNNYIHSEEIKVFYYDSYLMDLFGVGASNLTYCIGLYDMGRFGESPDYDNAIFWLEVPINIKLSDRGNPLSKDTVTADMEKRGLWYPSKSKERLEPPEDDKAVRPSGDKFFCFGYKFSFGKNEGTIPVTIRYHSNGDKILVSDDHSNIYYIDINSMTLIWKYEVYKDTPFELHIDDISPDERFFLTTSRLQREDANSEINIHRMNDGRVIRKIIEKSNYFYQTHPEITPDDLRGEMMIAVGGEFINNVKDFTVIFRNRRMDHGMYDFSLKCYDTANFQKKWEWQVVDPQGMDRNSPGRSLVYRFLMIDRNDPKYLLFSETGEVRLLTMDIIRKAEKEVNIYKKVYGDIQYRLNIKNGYYPQSFAETKDKNRYYTSFIDDDGYGQIGMINVMNGKTEWLTSWEKKIGGIVGIKNGDYIISRVEKNWNLWDVRSKYIISSGPYFYQSSFQGMAIHPIKKEIAVAYNNNIYFMVERERKYFKVSNRLLKSEIFIDENSEINAYSDGDIQLLLSPEEKFSDDEEKYMETNSFRMNNGGPYNWDKFYFQRHGGRELYLRSFKGAFIEMWGGWSQDEFNKSISEKRANLPIW